MPVGDRAIMGMPQGRAILSPGGLPAWVRRQPKPHRQANGSTGLYPLQAPPPGLQCAPALDASATCPVRGREHHRPRPLPQRCGDVAALWPGGQHRPAAARAGGMRPGALTMAPIREVTELLGHSSLNQTMQYVHLALPHTHAIVNRMTGQFLHD